MLCALSIEVRLHDDRYHGSGAWPPSPARLYQALVAGSARGCEVDPKAADWLRWLERLSAPLVALPHSKLGKAFDTYVPNNDLDAKGGDPAMVASIRAAKRIQPRLLAPGRPLVFLWKVSAEQRASMPCEPSVVVDQLYQFGRGIDPAWARAQWLDEAELDEYRQQHEGVFYEPGTSREGAALDCPQEGSLASLEAQFAGKRTQFALSGTGRKAKQLFTRAPKPSFARVAYNAPPARQVFEFRSYEGTGRTSTFAPRRLYGISALVVRVRDLALERLTSALPAERAAWAEHALRGRDNPHLPDARCRLIPLPSIGHVHADRQVRRLLVEVPGDCLISADDIFWAFSGLSVNQAIDEETGEVLSETRLVTAADDAALRHFGAADGSRGAKRFRTVTPAALPESTRRRRIDPARQREEAKGGAEFAEEHRRAVAAVRTALRHAGIHAAPMHISVQRQPFEGQGDMAERFAEGTRFAKERLWHVDVEFSDEVRGPLTIGDGRFLGLGVMAPAEATKPSSGILALRIVDSPSDALSRPEEVARAFRRAVIARVQHIIGNRKSLHSYIHGHAEDGSPLSDGNGHISFHVDATRKRLLVMAPHAFLHQKAGATERPLWGEVVRALSGMRTLFAGPAGVLGLAPTTIDTHADPLLQSGTRWESASEYTPTRYAKSGNIEEDLLGDLRTELARAKLPKAHAEVLSVREGPRGGLHCRFRLSFDRLVEGPIALGRTKYLGGGLFQVASQGHGEHVVE